MRSREEGAERQKGRTQRKRQKKDKLLEMQK
jgi:hypothetical protein